MKKLIWEMSLEELADEHEQVLEDLEKIDQMIYPKVYEYFLDRLAIILRYEFTAC